MNTHSPSHTDVAIIGAGFAGVGMGIQLKRRQEHTFRIFERAGQIGGTWRDNTYPGIACDVPAHLYSFSFAPNPNWSGLYAPGLEISSYLEDCSVQEGLHENLILNADVTEARWDQSGQLWRLTTTQGSFTSNTLVLGCGRLTEPRIPSVPGVDSFTGESFHSARWRHEVNLDGKRIAVIGSGASAVQIVPELARVASELIVLQRSAPYILPREEHQYSVAERAMFKQLPQSMKSLRSQLFWKQEEMFAQRLSNGQAVTSAREKALNHLKSNVHDAQRVQQLTPNYELGCKRVLISNTFYPAFNKPNVHLQSTALAAVEAGAVVGKDGSRFDVDVIVYATGFHSARQPFASRVFGRQGASLDDYWSNGMKGFASTTVHGFPNLFVLNGPNSGLGHSSSIFMIETQIEYVLAALQFLNSIPESSLEVSAEAEQAYVRAIDAQSAETVWINGGCSSWYVDPTSGRQTLLWPDFAYAFRTVNGSFDSTPYLTATTQDSKPAELPMGARGEPLAGSTY
jgi:cation diffusion facilitator CzcD-associated flavoprotein CzcO